MGCVKALLVVMMNFLFLQFVNAQQILVVEISAKVVNPSGCSLLSNATYGPNTITIKLNDNLEATIASINGEAKAGVILSTSIPLNGNTLTSSISVTGNFRYGLDDCAGWSGGKDELEHFTGNLSESIPINFTGTCLNGTENYTRNTVKFRLIYSFTLNMTAPIVTPASIISKCNTDFVNLQVNNTAPAYTWQVRNPLGNWIPFRNDASNSIVATRQELQAAAGNSAYDNRNVRVLESGCLTNRAGPSSAVFNFHVPPPEFSVVSSDQKCHNANDGSVAVTIVSASPATVNDFIVNLHDPAIPIDPNTGYSPPIVDELLNDLSNHMFDGLGVDGNSSKEYYITIENNTNNNLYGSCRSIAKNFVITNPDPIVTNFTRSLKNGYDISCNGSSNGQITVSPSGGVGNYHNFSWSNGATSPSVSGLSVGDYTVSYRDGNNCLGSGQVTITQPDALTVSIHSNNKALYNNFDVSCPGAFNGYITASASGGVNGKSYQWNDGNTGPNYSGLGVGNYSVTVTDGNGCAAGSNISLTSSPPIIFSITEVTGIDCPGGSTGSLAVNAVDIINEIGTVSYAWSSGGTANTKQNLSAGNYGVTITDVQGCTAYAERTLTNPEAYTVSITPQSNYDGNYISCSSAADGVLGATLLNTNQNPVPGLGFNWYKNEMTAGGGATIYGLNEGSYRVEAVYGNNCIAEDTYFLDAPEPYLAAISVQSNYNGASISCNGFNDGALAVTLFDEHAQQTEVEYYAWSRNGVSIAMGESLNSINNLIAGEYSVATTYNGGCISNGHITLTDPDPVDVQIQPDTDYNGYIISCVGESNGALLAVASGGTGAYTYVWDTGIESASITNIGAGAYAVTVTDINNCSADENFIVEDPPVLAAFIEITSDFSGFPISCAGQSDGALLATAAGGTDNYIFQWNTGVNTDALTNIAAGEYEVIATDENGCTAHTIINIEDPPPVEVSIAVISDYNGQAITCAGAANGRLEALANGGTNTFSYAWSMGTVGSIQNNLASGLYEVVATDENGCQAVGQQELLEPEPVSASILNVSDYNGFGVSCANAQNGFIEVAGAGGTGVFLFTWTDQTETSHVLSDIGVGLYTVTVTDSNGCSDETSKQITEPALLTLEVVNKNDITCFGDNSGSITVQANGGVTAYTYAINTVEYTSEAVFSSLAAGDYTLHAYDANNCYTSISETLQQPSQVEISFENIEPAFCDDPRGSASAIVSGGVMNYTYQWKNNVSEVIDQDNTIENLAAGLYSLQIVDGNQCETSKILGIQATDGPVIATEETIPAKCSYSSDGSITMEVIDGDGPFTFLWQDGQTSATATNLAQGEYFVVVEDINNCVTVSSGIVSAPTPLVVSLVELKPPSCYGSSDGSIEVLGSGGTAPYGYDWGVFQGSIFPGRSKGNSYLTLYDSNQCSTQASYSLSEPTPLSLNLISRVLPTCYGECNGQMEVLAEGGNGEYAYNWNSGSALALASNLCSDNHTVIVHDTKGCTLQKTYALGQPAQLTPRLLVLDSPDCYNDCDGKLSVDAIGGVGDYTYLWSNGNTNTNMENLCAGTYIITIHDAHECETQQTHQLLNPDELTIDLGESRTICEGQTHTLSVAGTWSSYLWTSNVNFQSEATQVTINTAGQYWLAVTNALGCVARDTFLLATSTDLLKASFIIPAEANVNDTIVMIDITWPLAESISWQLPTDLVVLQDLNEVVYGKFLKAGVYNIGLHAQLSGCHDEITKSISILGTTPLAEEALLGYAEFVKTFEVYPNPTQGRFTVALQFAEETFATLSIWDVLTGKVIKQINLEENQDFSVDVDLHPLPPGSYVLRMDYRGGVKYLRFVVN